MGFYLRKKRLDTLVGALCCVGRGFGRAGRAGPGWAQIWLCLARSAGLGVGFGRAGRLGWVGRGVWLWWARWAGLGADLAFCVWSTLYMSSSCLHDVFVFIFMCISNGIMGLEQNKAWHS